MSGDELIEASLHLGCHQTDIGDAFEQADPEWVERPGGIDELSGARPVRGASSGKSARVAACA
jgi:hypothetical protein